MTHLQRARVGVVVEVDGCEDRFVTIQLRQLLLDQRCLTASGRTHKQHRLFDASQRVHQILETRCLRRVNDNRLQRQVGVVLVLG